MTESAGRLMVVATPIGNLDDLSPRAAQALRRADLVLAEDTRRTGRLLAHIDADAPQRSFHEHNERERTPQVIDQLRGGATIALAVDAGTPGVSDPGYRLVDACHAAGIVVEVVPGPSAVLAALVASGLATDRFVFEGFLPRKGSSRRQRLADLAAEPRTVVVFVAPHRAEHDLADLAAACGEHRPAALARELTKLHEEVRRGSLGSLMEAVAEGGLRGEMTLVVAGAPDVQTSPAVQDLVAAVEGRVRAGSSRRDAIAAVAEEAGVSRRELYQAVVAPDASGNR